MQGSAKFILFTWTPANKENQDVKENPLLHVVNACPLSVRQHPCHKIRKYQKVTLKISSAIKGTIPCSP